MLVVLMLFGGLQQARAGDISKDTNYVTKQNVSCPASGLFFQRETGLNSLGLDICYICFCQNNSTATCWRRENKRCDLEHYRDFPKRIPRTRRSPLSLGEIFLRDAARDFFNKQSPEQCKPFESSFSDGCPPADWCIGCTVCDCDANGRWDCHILSFCPDKNGKKQMKKRRGHPRNRIAKRQSRIASTKAPRATKTTTKPPKKPARKRFVKSKDKGNQVKQSSAVNKHNINQVKASKINKITAIKKPLPKIQVKKGIPSITKVTSRPLYIKKNVSTSKPVNIKSGSTQSNKINTSEVAQKVVKQFMTTMQKVLKNINRKTNNTSKQVNKVVKKRSMSKKDNKRDTKKGEQKPIFVKKNSSKLYKKDFSRKNTSKYHSSSTSKYGRIKRAVTDVEYVTLKSDSFDSNAWHSINYTNKNAMIKRINNLLANNSIASVLNISLDFNNQSVNVTQLENSTNQIKMSKNGSIYNGVNKTEPTIHWTVNDYGFQQNTFPNKVEEILYLTTDRPYVPLRPTSEIKFNNNAVDLLEKNKDRKNQMVTKFINASNQTMYNEDYSCKYRTFLLKLIGSDREHNINKTQSLQTSKRNTIKPKKYTILNKIKRLFKKIFNKKSSSKFYYQADVNHGDNNIEDSNENIENCKLNPNEKKILRQRINELKSESERILRIIGIIKGLLHFLEISTNTTQYRLSSKLNDSNETINKLNIIVKNTDYRNGKELTADQRTQINYIKDNVQVFIQSIGKFANILDDVIQIAMCHNKYNYTKVNKSNNVNTNLIKHYSNSTQHKLEKLKKLIFKYNNLQNDFIHQINFILNNLEKSITDKYNLKPLLRSDYYGVINKTDAIEANSANIIKNIRKLKLLAERIQNKNRRKRNTIDDDDALEYLLILMEYLLKRHGPANSSVNDGLDLLIDAIKSAPDIKVIRKKVLDNMTENPLVTRTITPIHSSNKNRNYSTSKIDREQKSISAEVNKNKNKIADQSEDGEDVDDDEKIEEIYRSFKSDKHLSSEQTNKQDAKLSAPSVIVTSESYYNFEETTTRTSRIKNEGVARYKVIDDSFEEKVTSSTAMIVDLDTTPMNLVTDYSKVININLNNQPSSNSNIDNFLVDSKANVDWIEENFKEIKQSNELATVSSTPKSVAATRTHKYKENMSDVSNENDLRNGENVLKTSAEEVMSKKQLELLNSLDYVEDDVDSKDDKYSNDAYV